MDCFHLHCSPVSPHPLSLPSPWSRKLTASLQNIQTHLQSHSEDGGCYLPPQDSLQDWFRRGWGLAAQSATLLQQLSWLLQCCPEEPQQREQTGASSRRHTLMCPSPLAVQQQPPGCLLRRGDPGWTQLQQQVAAMLKDSQSVKEQLASSGSILCSWYSIMQTPSVPPL